MHGPARVYTAPNDATFPGIPIPNPLKTRYGKITYCFGFFVPALILRCMPESDKWKIVKVAGVLGEVVERSKAILGIIFGVGTIGGVVSYYYSLYAQYQTYVLWALALFAIVTAVVVTWRVCLVLARRAHVAIAAEYLRLENAYVPFQREAVKLLYQISLGAQQPIKLKSLETALANYLEAVCNTAADIFEAKKRMKRPITANIKRIEVIAGASGPRFVYKPLVRSSKYDQKRFDYDEGLEMNPLEVETNYVYRRIFGNNYRNDFFTSGDIKALLSEIANSDETSIEPNARSTKFYQSFTIYPILGLMEPEQLGAEVGLEKYMQYKNKNVFGLMCVDSAKKRAFDQGADADIMKHLTSYAFGAFNLMQVVSDLARRKGLAVETD